MAYTLKIIGRLLLNEHITAEEASILIEEHIQSNKLNVKAVDTPPSEKIDEEETEKFKEILRRIDELGKGKPYNPFDIHPFKDPFKDPFPNPYTGGGGPYTIMFGDVCACNPKNGGNGICNCVMANEPVNPGTRSWIATSTGSSWKANPDPMSEFDPYK